MHRAFAELLTQAGVDRLRETCPGARFLTGNRDVVKLRIDDAPLDEGIDEDVFLFRGDEALGLGRIERQDALVEIAHVLDHRPLEVETGFGDDLANLTQLEDDGMLTLIDGEDHRPEQDEHTCGSGRNEVQTGFHQRTSRSRERKASRVRTSGRSATCGGVSWVMAGAGREAVGAFVSVCAGAAAGTEPAACISLSSGR